MSSSEWARVIFVLWPLGLFLGIFIYGVPHMACAFPNLTITYNAANCSSYNADPMAGVNQILLLAMTAMGSFGWVALTHNFLPSSWKDSP